MSLEQRITDGQARVAVMGLGYVGLPLLQTFFEAGFDVLGFDVDATKVEALKAGRTYISHLDAAGAKAMAASSKFDATTDPARLAEADAIMICVPTPLGAHLEPDLGYVESTADAVAGVMRPGQLVVLESTTYPGTTREVVLPRLEASGLTCGEAFFVAYSPEREDPGRKDQATRSVPKLVGGVDDVSGDLAAALYGSAFDRVIRVGSAEVAEAAKLLENVYRAVNIALANEMKVVLEAMGVDVWEVIDAAATKPFGFQPFYPGPGLGGHCIPIDPFYLAWKAREVGQDTRFVELAGRINRSMPMHVVHRTAEALNHDGKAVRGAKVLVLGVAYKPNVSDLRESPAFEIIEQLRDLGAEVDYNDPHVPETPKVRRHDLRMRSVDLSAERVAAYDAVVIVTSHDAYDWPTVFGAAKLVIDTRGVSHKLAVETRGRVVRA